MKVLVCVASRHHSTQEIAEAVAQELRSAGVQTDVRTPDEEPYPAGYDAVIVGSAVYMGHWLGDARAFVEDNVEQLKAKPVWLFSCGPLGNDRDKPQQDALDLSRLMESTNARGHASFFGKLDKAELGLGERLIASVVHAPEGDFRDWDAIRAWARTVAAELTAPVSM
jgi:menaquinone-dependent protoporphyrinogen oxidase